MATRTQIGNAIEEPDLIRSLDIVDNKDNKLDNVGTESTLYTRMKRDNDWDLIWSLLGGVLRMQREAQVWLPKFKRETQGDYQIRLSQTFLFNGVSGTAKRLSSKPYQKPVTVAGKFDDELNVFITDADGKGTSITEFAKNILMDATQYGLSHVLVDMPVIQGKISVKEKEERGLRPKWIHYKALQLFNWEVDENDNLTEIRLKEWVTEKKGKFGNQRVEQVRIIRTNDFELWRRKEGSNEWAMTTDEAVPHDFGMIPLVTWYTEKTGLLTANAPLRDLAWTNLEHYISASDQRAILHIVRVAILFLKALQGNDTKGETVVGSNNLIETNNNEADVKFVEHTGAGIEAGERDLDSLEKRMEQQGSQPLIRDRVRTTATANTIGESKAESDVQFWVKNGETVFNKLFKITADIMGIKEDTFSDDFKVDIFDDFAISARTVEDIKALQTDRMLGVIRTATYLREARKRGLYGEELDIDEEIEATKDEEPNLLTGRQDDKGEPNEEEN